MLFSHYNSNEKETNTAARITFIAITVVIYIYTYIFIHLVVFVYCLLRRMQYSRDPVENATFHMTFFACKSIVFPFHLVFDNLTDLIVTAGIFITLSIIDNRDLRCLDIHNRAYNRLSSIIFISNSRHISELRDANLQCISAHILDCYDKTFPLPVARKTLRRKVPEREKKEKGKK